MLIPEGFSQVAPYIFATDADKYMDHLLAALGGVDAGRTMRDGKLANGQIRFGDAGIMVAETQGDFGPSQSATYFYVEDADASMKQALDAGMTLIFEAQDMDYGDRQGGVKDAAGNIWWISQRLTDAPYD